MKPDRLRKTRRFWEFTQHRDEKLIYLGSYQQPTPDGTQQHTRFLYLAKKGLNSQPTWLSFDTYGWEHACCYLTDILDCEHCNRWDKKYCKPARTLYSAYLEKETLIKRRNRNERLLRRQRNSEPNPGRIQTYLDRASGAIDYFYGTVSYSTSDSTRSG